MNSLMKFSLFCLLLSYSSLFAQEKAKLGESEIRDSEKIKFTNRSNARAAENVKRQNDQIGRKLSEMIEAEPNSVHEYKDVSVRRIYADKNGHFGGDIISLDSDSGFGHINSIYRILASYIQNSFGYQEDRADIIALYVLYYNAMHRSEKSYFKTKYSEKLLDVLKVNSTGIGKTFKEWPGRTQIVIPLEGNVLKENEIDITLDELGNEVNKIIDEKKNGQEEKKKFAEVVKEKIIEEKKLLEEKKEELKVKEEKIALRDADKKNPPEIKKEIIEPKKEIVEVKKETVEPRKAEIKPEPPKEVVKTTPSEPVKTEPQRPVAKETNVVKNEKPLEKAPETKKEPTVETKKLEKELAVVKQELAKKIEVENKKKEFSPNVIDGKIVFLKVVKYDTSEGHFNSEIHLIDPEKDDAVLKSDFNKICSRQFKEFGGNIVVVGFKDGHKDEHQLYLINKKDLKENGKSTSNVFSRTVIEIIGDELYAFEFEKGAYYISKFDKGLRRLIRSDKDINPDSNLTFYGKKIYVTGKAENGNAVDIRIFNKDDLKFITKIQP